MARMWTPPFSHCIFPEPLMLHLVEERRMRFAMLCAAACLAASHAFASNPAFCMAKNSWTCAGPGPWIGKLDGMDPDSAEARHLASPGEARCTSYSWLNPEEYALVFNRISVMLVEEPYAYVCSKTAVDGGINIFGCEWALTTDVRDSNWRRVSHDDLARSAHSTTAYDIVESSRCPLPSGAR